jgi:hypothetical protein
MIGAALLLGACAHPRGEEAAGGEQGANAYPANYKSDILAAMHAYLNDPTGVRDAAISEPALKPIGGSGISLISSPPEHYVVCVQFNPKALNGYAGVKQIAAVFIAGRFDRFIETAKEVRDVCADAAYAPFPELEKLSR